MKLRPDTLAMTAVLAMLTALGPLSTDFYLPSLPEIVQVMRTDVAGAQATLSSFLFGFAAGQIVWGPLSDRLGQRNAFILALFTFLIGSVLCALSTSLTMLVAARTLQGAGGAVLTPVSRLLVVRSADKSELLNAMNWLLLPSIVGPMMGPVVGGQLVTYATWHWIFNIGSGVMLAGMTFFVIAVTVTALQQRAARKQAAPAATATA